jgi:hypothetical protein
MSHDVFHIYRLTGIVDFRDQSIFVAADVENSACTEDVSVREDLLNIVQVTPLRLAARLVPFSERRFCVLMLLPKLTKRFLTDNIHSQSEYTILGYLINLAFYIYAESSAVLTLFDLITTPSVGRLRRNLVTNL